MGSLAGPLGMPLGGDSGVDDSVIICNQSRGTAAPTVSSDPSGTKALDTLRVSIRHPSSFISVGDIQLGVGYSSVHAQGSAGRFDLTLPRTKLGSLLSPNIFVDGVTFSQIADHGLAVTKSSSSPQASVFFTSVDRGDRLDKSAMLTAVMQPQTVAGTHFSDTDPMGPVIGLEHGLRNTAVYCFFLNNLDDDAKVIRICGPDVGGTRVPDVVVPCDWTDQNRYVLFWNEQKSRVELWADFDTIAGIGTPNLITTVPISDFQAFGAVGTRRVGGANDITGIYGVEGAASNEVSFDYVGTAIDAGTPVRNGALAGGWKSYLDSDVTMGFSGSVDPTRLKRGGAWFVTGTDTAGILQPLIGIEACRIEKVTASHSFGIYRDEPGFAQTQTDGLMAEFKVNVATLGGSGFNTGAAIKIEDGVTLFQLDFFSNGTTYDVGVLLKGGDPGTPSDHLQTPSPVDFRLKTLRLVVDPRREKIDLYDTADLITPIVSWDLDRATLPSSGDTKLTVGLPVTSTPAVGTMDVFSFKYSYLYQAWEVADDAAPTAADPPFTAVTSGGGGGGPNSPLGLSCMPGIGIFPLAFDPGSSGGGGATGTITDEGYQIQADGGETLFYYRAAPFDVNRGAIIEAAVKIESWHPNTRTGVFMFIDDAIKAYMLSFVENETGRYVCIPMSAGLGDFQEFAGEHGFATKVSVKIDWTETHVYRLERRPRDATYLYIDNSPIPALVLPDNGGYSFPSTQFDAQQVGFGQVTDEGATSVWQFARDCFGAGFEINTSMNLSEDDVRTRFTNALTTVIVNVGA